MNTKQRIRKLEKQKPASVDNTIQIFITTEDGGAWTYDTTGKHIEYTAAEFAELQKQSAARGEKFIHITPASLDNDA